MRVKVYQNLKFSHLAQHDSNNKIPIFAYGNVSVFLVLLPYRSPHQQLVETGRVACQERREQRQKCEKYERERARELVERSSQGARVEIQRGEQMSKEEKITTGEIKPSNPWAI